jgi:RHS repeat-associated protein
MCRRNGVAERSARTVKRNHNITSPFAIAMLAGMLGGLGALQSAHGQQLLQNAPEVFTTQASEVAGQDVSPLAVHRVTALDGSMLRAGGMLPIGGANPFAADPAPSAMIGDISLVDGGYSPTAIDYVGTARGEVGWVIGRTYSQLQRDGTAAHSSAGYQGTNWHQMSQPELRLRSGAGTGGLDIIEVVLGADRFLQYQQTATSATTYQGVNGAAGIIEKSGTGTSMKYTLHTPTGTKIDFFGEATTGGGANLQLWRIVATDGRMAFVGHGTDIVTAAADGYSAAKGIIVAYDGSVTGATGAINAAGRRYTYGYSGSPAKLISVVVEERSGANWTGATVVAEIDYSYYGASSSNGLEGQLQQVTVTTPNTVSGSSEETVRSTYYRYYTGTFNGGNNPGNSGNLKLVVHAEGVRAYNNANGANAVLTATDAALGAFSAAVFEYAASDNRIVKAALNGECGCSGSGGNGTYTFTYEVLSSFSNSASSYDQGWCGRTLVNQPDTSEVVFHFDEAGQVVTKTLAHGTSPTLRWTEHFTRDSVGRVTASFTPAAVNTYTPSTGIVALHTGSSTKGLHRQYVRESSGTLTGFVTAVHVADGAATAVGSGVKTHSTTYGTTSKSIGSVTLYRPLTTESRALFGTGSGDYNATTTSYTYWGSSGDLALAVKSATTTSPTVSTGNNGSGTASVSSRHYLQDGSLTVSVEPKFSGSSYNRYTVYDVDANGRTLATYRDASSTNLGSGNAWGLTPNTTASDLTTTMEYDVNGRVTAMTSPTVDNGSGPGTQTARTYYRRLTNGNLATISFPDSTGSGGSIQLVGPAQVSVTNHAGKPVASMLAEFPSATATIAESNWSAMINVNSTDPTTVVNANYLSTSGTADDLKVSRLTAQFYSSSGHQLTSSRQCQSLGTSDYLQTAYTYDSMGRGVDVTDATGTITRSVYDGYGRLVEREVGTTDLNVVPVETIQYDGGASGGNSLVTQRTLHVNGANTRVYTYQYDTRNRLKVSVVPAGVHTVTNFDNLNRVVASAGYSSSSGLTASTDAVSNTTNRVSLSESLYDEAGRVWKSVRHKITQSGGSSGASTDTLDSVSWYDASGRVVASRGGSVTKTNYDRLGRVDRMWTLSQLGSTGFTSVYDAATGKTLIAGDTVVEESRMYRDAGTGLPLMQVQLSRAHTNTSGTGGFLSGGDDTDLSAVPSAGSTPTWRANISCTWYDDRNRAIVSGTYGNNGGAAFDRDSVSTAPTASSATVLVSTTEYAADGSVMESTDPKGIASRVILDFVGRKHKTIANYTDGTPGGGTNNDQDQVVEYGYTNGLMTTMTAKMPSSGDDQVTEYYYGLPGDIGTNVNASDLYSNSKLYKVIYPVGSLSDVADRTVYYAYNRQGQQRRFVDQAGNITTTAYDAAGREVIRSMTLMTGFIDDVRRIEMSYDARGMVSTVTQYDAEAGGTALDEVKYGYDDWGNVTTFGQDVDSAYSGSGTGKWDISYTYVDAGTSTTPNLIRRDRATLPGEPGSGNDRWTIEYNYATSGTIDNNLSRVAGLKQRQTTSSSTYGVSEIAQYQYLGMGSVVGTTLPILSNSLSYTMYDPTGTPSQYTGLDRYGRIIESRWDQENVTKPDPYHTTIAYDYNSNITVVDDEIAGNDTIAGAVYAMDDLNRVISADQGRVNGSGGSASIDSGNRWRKELWTLGMTGNWNVHSIGDNSSGNNKLSETGTFNTANERTGRTRTTPNTTSDTLTYDAVGNMIADGKGNAYVYDGFGRLREVRIPGESNRIRNAYRYNGLGMRISQAINASGGTTDNDVTDSTDPVTWFAYDERWRIVATYSGTANAAPSDTATPKERYLYHAAGVAGSGSSSYIDSLIHRDRDLNETDGNLLEERTYILQNWRADVVATANSTGTLIERMRYSAYGAGVTYLYQGTVRGDFNGDGGVDGDDVDAFFAAWSVADSSADANLDGGVNGDDVDAWFVVWNQGTASQDFFDTQPGACQTTSLKFGYAGYVRDGSVNNDREYTDAKAGLYHVRNRVYDPELGRWTRRDPIGYVDGPNVYEYVGGRVVAASDAYGLLARDSHDGNDRISMQTARPPGPPTMPGPPYSSPPTWPPIFPVPPFTVLPKLPGQQGPFPGPLTPVRPTQPHAVCEHPAAVACVISCAVSTLAVDQASVASCRAASDLYRATCDAQCGTPGTLGGELCLWRCLAEQRLSLDRACDLLEIQQYANRPYRIFKCKAACHSSHQFYVVGANCPPGWRTVVPFHSIAEAPNDSSDNQSLSGGTISFH